MAKTRKSSTKSSAKGTGQRKAATRTKKVAGSTPQGQRSASQLKAQIKRLDRQLLTDCNQRAELVQQLAAALRGAGKEAVDISDEWESLEQLLQRNRGPLETCSVRAILRELGSGCRSLVSRLKVAFLGPEFSYSHLAAVERFGQSCELIPVTSIAAVFQEVDCGQADFGLVPIENSTDGRIVDTLEMFARLPVRICGEVQLRIHHQLLGKCARAEVREVYSKPQALSQCRDWLAKHLSQARLVETASTTAAAELAAQRPGATAIASRQAAVNYGLDVLASNIEDNQDNVTRFAVIGTAAAQRTGRDKTSLMFDLPHQPGALADAMVIFKRNRLNLTWIESFPKRGSTNEYLFFVEMEGHPQDLRVRRAISSLERKAVRVDILGSYAKSQPID